MASTINGPAWKPHKIVRLHNTTGENLHLQMDTGTFRLDAHRSMKFVATVLDYPEIKALVDQGALTWEKA